MERKVPSPVIDNCTEVKWFPFCVMYRLATILLHLTTNAIPYMTAFVQPFCHEE